MGADYAETWVQVASPVAYSAISYVINVASPVAYSAISYVREITHIGDGVVLAYVAGNEDQWDDRALRYYQSLDWGVTWTPLANQFTSSYGPLNSVYEVAVVDKGDGEYALLGATQPDSDIIHAWL
ncbi:hypothetical protein KIPB_013506 [Kipferlia bialata]|uniref:Uncharacterized protein n=1 Tax=Kipferlia bialata TaxID=797122 RepID=A0A9K3D7Y7_9EUKA|nr:hypothetical protein KIPB_013506 [Kipferlia bialata]|eukprot:g13506.t1